MCIRIVVKNVEVRAFTDYLEKTIDKEMEQAPLSPEDSIRKSSIVWL